MGYNGTDTSSSPRAGLQKGHLGLWLSQLLFLSLSPASAPHILPMRYLDNQFVPSLERATHSDEGLLFIMQTSDPNPNFPKRKKA